MNNAGATQHRASVTPWDCEESMFHFMVEVIDMIITFALLPTALFAIKGFLTHKSLTPKFDRCLIELFWVEMIIGFVTGSILYHHRIVDISGAIYLTAWRILVNLARRHPTISNSSPHQANSQRNGSAGEPRRNTQC
jgi:hypothetical protein